MKKYFILCLISYCLYTFYNKNLQDLLLLTLVFAIYFLLYHINNKFENFTTPDEAIQNLASMWNDGNIKATNLTLTGDLTVNGKSILTKNTILANGKLLINGDDTSATIKAMGKFNIDGSDALNLVNTGGVNVTNTLSATKNINADSAKIGKINIHNNIVGDDVFYIGHKNSGIKYSFTNYGTILRKRCDGWETGDWNNGWDVTMRNGSCSNGGKTTQDFYSDM